MISGVTIMFFVTRPQQRPQQRRPAELLTNNGITFKLCPIVRSLCLSLARRYTLPIIQNCSREAANLVRIRGGKPAKDILNKTGNRSGNSLVLLLASRRRTYERTYQAGSRIPTKIACHQDYSHGLLGAIGWQHYANRQRRRQHTPQIPTQSLMIAKVCQVRWRQIRLKLIS